jgi:TusA-related sulfurtransferase
MIKRLFDAFKLLKKQAKAEEVTKLLTDDPLTIELIERIAFKNGYQLEIVQRDGTILRFVKMTGQQIENPVSEVW